MAGSLPELPIPVVDLSHPEEECARILKEACESSGFFYLVNHGVPASLLARAFEQTEALFSLPKEELHRVSQDKNNRGYTPLGEESLDPGRQKERGDTKEGYYIGNEIPEDHPLAQLPLHGPNQWPNSELVPEFRPTMEEYHSTCKAVCMRLLRVMALALRLPGDYFYQPGRFDQAICAVRLLHYTREMSRPDRGVFGAGAHSDYGMLTLLAARGPGLQICKDRSQSPQVWEDVLPVEGAYVVNIGDMLERWTNGKWRSTLHRVIIPPGMDRDRYSMAVFFESNYNCVVEALPTCTSANDPPKWPPTVAGEHLLGRYKKTQRGLHETLKAA